MMKSYRFLIAGPLLLMLFTFDAGAQLNDGSKFADILFPATNQLKTAVLTPLSPADIMALQDNIDLKKEDTSFAIASVRGLFEKIKENDGNATYYLEQLSGLKKFYFGDGREGLLCSSYFGAEDIYNVIWQKRGNKYVFSGELEGEIFKIFRNNNKQPFTIVTRSGWCCASGIGAYNLYSPYENAGVTTYRLIQSIQEHIRVKMPETRMEPKKVRVKEARYRLREAPEIDDKPYPNYPSDVEGVEVIGNILAEFTKGSIGSAVSEYDDKAGRIWWFVIMEPQAELPYTRFNHNDKGKKQYTMGWMSSRYLEIVK